MVYRSTPARSHSNYFYSVYSEEQKCFVWQNVQGFVEMRPSNREAAREGKEEGRREGMEELQTVEFADSGNKGREIIEDTVLQEVRENWEVSREEYLAHLAK